MYFFHAYQYTLIVIKVAILVESAIKTFNEAGCHAHRTGNLFASLLIIFKKLSELARNLLKKIRRISVRNARQRLAEVDFNGYEARKKL